MISEGHQVQFPADIEVFYVSPPALDDFRSWLQRWVAKQQQRLQDSGQEASQEIEDAGSEGEEGGGGTRG